MLILGLKYHCTGRFSCFQSLFVLHEHVIFELCLLVTAYASLFLDTLDTVLDGLKVLELQLKVNDLLVADRVHRAVDVYNVVVVEATQNVYDCVGLTYVSEELVAEALALARTLYKACDVHNVTCSRDNASGVYQFGELVQSLIGYGYLSHLCVDCTEGEVRCLCLCTRQTVEKCRFSYVGQANDTCFQSHIIL